eukprot:1198104-Rhodomonas_salina.2
MKGKRVGTSGVQLERRGNQRERSGRRVGMECGRVGDECGRVGTSGDGAKGRNERESSGSEGRRGGENVVKEWELA